MPVLDDSDYSEAAKDLRLAEASHSELYIQRKKLQTKEEQNKVAPYEHRAFAREFARESPLQAAVSIPFAAPLYTAAKALGLQKARSGASMEEIKQAYIGLAEGLTWRRNK
jgi:multidrug resistance efflux pump